MLLWIAAALAQEAPPVVNGSTTASYPEVVLLYLMDASGYGAVCTGSLVAEEWVLTAAHCVTDSRDLTIDEVYVFVGKDSNNLEQQAIADAWYPHEDYSSSDVYYDIAMVHLDRSFRNVDLMAVNEDAFARADRGVDFRVVGYGITSDRDTSQTSAKRYADIPLYDYDGTLAVFYDEPEEQNACHGDSGGPVLQLRDDGGYAVAGIVNTAYPFNGSDCERNGFTAARVDAYIDWIEGFTPVYTYDELYGDGPSDPGDTGTDPGDTDTPGDTGTADTGDDGTDDGTMGGDPVRPADVGEDYGTDTLLGCAAAPATPASGTALAGLALALGTALGRRRRP